MGWIIVLTLFFLLILLRRATRVDTSVYVLALTLLYLSVIYHCVYFTVLSCTLLYLSLLVCTDLNFTVLVCTLLYFTVLVCTLFTTVPTALLCAVHTAMYCYTKVCVAALVSSALYIHWVICEFVKWMWT